MLGNIGPWGMIIILLIVVFLFGRGRISGLMSEMGKGLSSFRRGVQEGKESLEEENAEAAKDVTPEEEKEK